jgi:cell division protease FtsH
MTWLRKIALKIIGLIVRIRGMSVRSQYRLYATIFAIFLSWMAIHFLWPSVTLPEKTGAEVVQITPVSYTELIAKIKNYEVAEIQISSGAIVAVLKSGAFVTTRLDSRIAPPIDMFQAHKVEIVFTDGSKSAIETESYNYTPLLIILIWGVWGYFFFKVIGPRGEFRFWFTKNKRAYSQTTFADVAGVDEAKAELQEIVDFLRNPDKGISVPKGTLLVGPPGTGKTLLARAVAGESGVPFHYMAGSEFVEMFVGQGARRVRNLFDKAKEKTPCIIYIDEIDSVGAKKSDSPTGGTQEYNQTTNQLLTELDGFDQYPDVIMIASTNHPERLEPALIRSGRFGNHVIVALPDARGREEILKVHTRKVFLAPDVDLVAISLGTPGFSGADLANIVLEAGRCSKRENPLSKKAIISMRHFADAKDKIMMGAERKSLVVTDEDRMRTAYHEVGHAIVAIRTPGTDPVEKVSVMPRGRSLGVTIQLPSADRHHYTKNFLLARMAVMMGGRAAEEIFYDSNISAGAESDIEEATKLASNMVCRWGMGSVGPLTLKKQTSNNSVYNCSPDLAYKADEEIQKLVVEALDIALNVIKKERSVVKYISEELFEKTDLSGEEIQQIIDREELLAKKNPQ